MNMATLLQRAWKRFINVVPGKWKPELTFQDYACMRQERGNNLCGYYVCDFIREMAVYRDAEDAIHHSCVREQIFTIKESYLYVMNMRNERTWLRCSKRFWKQFINVVPGKWKPELTFQDYPCMRQERLRLYCDFIREMVVYRDAEDTIHHSRMMSLRDSLITEDRIRAIQEELTGFFLNEAIAKGGEYHREFT